MVPRRTHCLLAELDLIKEDVLEKALEVVPILHHAADNDALCWLGGGGGGHAGAP